MNELATQLSWAVAAAGLAMGVLAGIRTRHLGTGVAVLLDMLLAAGLLRLVAADTWSAIAVAAAVVAVRRLVGLGLGGTGSSGVRPRRSSTPPQRRPPG